MSALDIKFTFREVMDAVWAKEIKTPGAMDIKQEIVSKFIILFNLKIEYLFISSRGVPNLLKILQDIYFSGWKQNLVQIAARPSFLYSYLFLVVN